MLVLLAAALLAQNSAQTASNAPPNLAANTTQADPPTLVARLGHTKGDVSFMPVGTTDWAAGINNYPMKSGDRVFCDKDAHAEIDAGSTDVRLWESTDATLTNITNQYEQIGLAQGSIRVRIYSLDTGASVEVDTPNGAAVITQPGDYRFDIFPGDAGAGAIVTSGGLQITGSGGLNQAVTAGQAVQMTGKDPIQVTATNLPATDALDQWSTSRDQEVVSSQSAAYVSHDTPGYADLDKAGSWETTTDNGPIWYPTTVDPDWTPYSVGRWAYVAPWGYTWVDAASWGYATSHYGRWAYIGGRWGWAPGPPAVAPVYSPALVAFVGNPGMSIGASVGVTAWFPLGVGEPYVPWYHASPAYAQQVNVTNVNVANIHNTTIVNNYNNYIANTRTASNINQIDTGNIQYANRAQVTAVPAAAMSSGRSVPKTAVPLTPEMKQQLATAPVHVAPTTPAPAAQSLLRPRPNVPAPAARPTLVTPHGLAPATPAANPAHPGIASHAAATQPAMAGYRPPAPSSRTNQALAAPSRPYPAFAYAPQAQPASSTKAGTSSKPPKPPKHKSPPAPPKKEEEHKP